jgi:hypothetical protein
MSVDDCVDCGVLFVVVVPFDVDGDSFVCSFISSNFLSKSRAVLVLNIFDQFAFLSNLLIRRGLK